MPQLTLARNVLLVVGPLSYVLGYIVWSVIAWRQNLGQLPLLDAQYLVAGIPVLTVLLLTSAMVRFGHFVIVRWWPNIFEGRSLLFQFALYLLHTVFVGVLFITFAVFTAHPPSAVSPSAARVLGILALGLSFLVGTLSPAKALTSSLRRGLATQAVLTNSRILRELSRVRSSRLDRLASRLLVTSQSPNLYLVPIMMAAIVVVFYVNRLLPALPQALGGASPRIAELDLVVADLSSSSRAEFLSKPTEGTPVARSVRVRVYFSGTTQLLIGPLKDSDSPKFELARSVVKGIRWLE